MQSAVVGANHREVRPKILVDGAEARLVISTSLKAEDAARTTRGTSRAPDSAIGTAGSFGHLKDSIESGSGSQRLPNWARSDLI